MGESKRRREHCAYCGAPKTGEDHVPPKNLFPVYRTNLITVPACHEHNGRRSDLDENFRNYVATRVGNETPTTQELFDKTIRGVTRNKKLHRWNPDFSQFEVKIESDAFKPMIEWITRGLYGTYKKSACHWILVCKLVSCESENGYPNSSRIWVAIR